MAIVMPPFYFNNCTDNMTGTPHANTPGTTFTAGANDTDGTPVSLISAITHDVHFLVIAINGTGLNATITSTLADILVDPAGGSSWSTLINDLVCGYTAPSTAGAVSMNTWYQFPIYIKSGSSIGIQARTAHTANLTVPKCAIWAYGNPSQPEQWWCGTGVETLGVTPSTSAGTVVSPGASLVWGSWTDIGTSTSIYGCIQAGCNGGTDTGTAIKGYIWQLGYSSTILPGSTYYFSSYTANEIGTRECSIIPTWCDVPSGTTFQVRGMCDSNSPEDQEWAVYGVY